MNIATAGPVSEVSSKEIGDVAKQLLGPLAILIAGAATKPYQVWTCNKILCTWCLY